MGTGLHAFHVDLLRHLLGHSSCLCNIAADNRNKNGQPAEEEIRKLLGMWASEALEGCSCGESECVQGVAQKRLENGPCMRRTRL